LIDGVKFGETRISLEAVIKLIVVFGTGMVLTRWFQKLLRTTVLPRTRLDLGGQTALVTGVGYVGLTLAALIAVSAAGLNLSSLAVVAGALSVGIGFGLQTIVSNFVSGIILLIERPIKEGDWIEVSGYSGVVRKIAVRSTRIETFDQHDVIVPNSDLIAGTVKNMTLSSKTGRLVIPVGIAYGSDLEATRRIMLDAAANNQMVMRQPAPAVMFIGLGESSLDFELRCYLHEVGAGVSARSEILFEIYNELGKAGIEIPFPQRDIHLRDIDRLIEAIAGRALSPKLKGRSQTTTGTEAENAAQAK
jgi:potassium efflux system protein